MKVTLRSAQSRVPSSLGGGGQRVKTSHALIGRLGAFVALFVVFSGAIGSRIIGDGIGQRFGFDLYGGAGKTLLFGCLCLGIMVYREGLDVELRPWRFEFFFWVLAASTALLTWHGVHELAQGHHVLVWASVVNVGLFAGVIFIVLGTFGPSNTMKLLVNYRRQIIMSMCLSATFYVYLNLIYRLWEPLASIVLDIVSLLLRSVGIHATVSQNETLMLPKFGISVAKYCSGIESIALFTSLFLLVCILDWKRFNHSKVAAIFLPAIAALFFFNIMRVFVLILGGYYINAHIAFSLFHTYAGMLFFILYSMIFWAVSYRWLLSEEVAPV